MRLGNLAMLNRLTSERARLLTQRQGVEGGSLGVTISSNYQDDAMVLLVKPVVIAELTARIEELEADLVGLGVELV